MLSHDSCFPSPTPHYGALLAECLFSQFSLSGPNHEVILRGSDNRLAGIGFKGNVITPTAIQAKVIDIPNAAPVPWI